jgi:lambda family phage portal protein
MAANPQRRGASARASKKALDAQAKYDAAGTGRRIAAWRPGTRGPNAANENMQRLLDRAQDAVRNDWQAGTTIQKWATTLVGVGITPRWKNKRLGEEWRRYVPFADADGVLDAYGQQTLGVREWFSGGEYFIRERRRDLSLPLPAPVQFQLLPSEFCPQHLDSDAWPGLPAGNRIRQGVEFNSFGRRTAYWMHREHPHEYNARPTPDMLIRVPADQVRHVFEPKRAGQLRGVSELANVLVRLRASGNFEDAVLDRQLLANLYVGFVTKTMPESAFSEDNTDADTGLPTWYSTKAGDGSPAVGLESGIMQELLPGEDVKFSNPPEAGTTYSDYMRTMGLGTAAGAGMPYELMSGDIKDISDRAMRVIFNEFRRHARQRQWQVLIPMHCQFVIERWARACVLKGVLGESELAEAQAPEHSPEGWEYIHPTQDAEGKKLLLEMGVLSRQRIAGERGDDINVIDDERQTDLERSKAMGLEPVVAPAAPAAPPKKPQPTALDDTLAGIRASLSDLQRAGAEQDSRAHTAALSLRPDSAAVLAPVLAQMLDVMRAQSEQMAAITQAQAARPMHVAVAAPTVAVTNTVEPTPVSVTNNVSPTPVEMHTHVEPTPITNVLEQTIVAKAGEMTVDVNLPDRKIVSDIDHDADGRITHVEQTETTLTKPKKD